MTYLRAAAVLVLLGACGTDPAGDGPDAGRAPVTTDVTCMTVTRVATFPDGHHINSRYSYALVDVAPGDDFAVEQCGPTPAPTSCPPDATCTGNGGPAGLRCVRSYRSGTFVDGKLLVSCGQSSDTFVEGVVASHFEQRYDSTRVTVY